MESHGRNGGGGSQRWGGVSTNYSWRSDNQKQSEPSWWEKKFLDRSGSITWKQFQRLKPLTDIFGDIYRWDDYAGKVAFDNAKQRFWARLNGVPRCELPSLPDRDMHIDKIDWRSKPDPELYKDLDDFDPYEEEDKEEEKEEEDVVVESVFVGGVIYVGGQPVPPSGWSDHEEDVALAAGIPTCLKSLLKPIITVTDLDNSEEHADGGSAVPVSGVMVKQKEADESNCYFKNSCGVGGRRVRQVWRKKQPQ